MILENPQSYSPLEQEDSQTQELLSQVSTYLETSHGEVQPFSAEEYFLMLLKKGLEARQEGNYGIAAALVIRSKDVEIIVFGKNSVFSDNDPHGHAEMNAIKNAKVILNNQDNKDVLENLKSQGDVIIRNNSTGREEKFLITSLEPCPMCTVGSVINADVGKVLISTEDDFAGALEEKRLNSLSPLWGQTAIEQKLDVQFTQNINPDDLDSYIPKELQDMLYNLFFQTKTRLDLKLTNEGYINLNQLGIIAQAQLGVF